MDSNNDPKNRPHGEDLIPGGYEPRPVRTRQPGAMGGPPYGFDQGPGASTMDSETIEEHRKEGGAKRGR
jgi:hypothetical protein